MGKLERKKNKKKKFHQSRFWKNRKFYPITMSRIGGSPGRFRGAINMDGLKNRRGNPAADRVVFKEVHPLALRNHVKSRGNRSNQKTCMDEMMSLMDCLGKYNQDKSMCAKELTAFEKCSAQARIKNLELKESSKKMPIGPKAKVGSEHMNAYIKKFPQ